MEAHPRTFTPEALLAETDWMRRLARALVRDADAADELVQETVLAALRAKPDLDRGLRPWLGRVLRNVARQRTRSSARRTARERARFAPDDVAPEAGELAARVELQQLVVRLVLELDEPLRRTVLLRYFEGLEPAEIAASTGVPDGTVRWRLKRGLDEVRERLDERHGGHRDVWTSALLPFAFERTLVASSSAPTIGGALLMGTSKWWWMSAAALIACLTWWGMRPATPIERVAAPRVAEATLERSRETEPAPAPPETARAPITPSTALESAAASSTTRVRARFVDADGRPLSGVRFTGRVGEFSEQSTSGADGVAELATDLLTDPEQVEFSALGARFSSWSARERIEPGRLTELGDVRLTSGAAVTVRALGRDGSALESARVAVTDTDSRSDVDRARYGPSLRASTEVARTSEDGRARLEGLPPGSSIAWAEIAPEFWAWSEPFVLRAGEDAGLVVVRASARGPAPKLRIVVRAQDGGEIEELWTLWRRPGEQSFASQGGGHGKTLERTLDDTPRAAEVVVFDGRGRYGSARLADLEPRVEPYELVLGPGTRVPLLVVDEAGAPVVGARCGAFDRTLERDLGFGIAWSPEKDAVTVLDGPFDVEVRATGFAPARVGPFVAATAPRPIRVVLRTRPGLSGRLVDERGPVAGESVTLLRVLERPNARNRMPCFLRDSGSPDSRTDAEGNFRLDVRERGRYVVACFPEGRGASYSTELDVDPDVGANGVELRLGAGGRVEGRVLGADGRGVAGAIVGLTRGRFDSRTARSDGEGRYAFDAIGAGEWYVYRAQEMLDPWSTVVEGLDVDAGWTHPVNCGVRDGETTRFDLRLEPARASDVRVVLRVAGREASGWRAVLERLSGNDPFAQEDGDAVELDERGVAELHARSAGRFGLTLIGPESNGVTARIGREFELTGSALELALDVNVGGLDLDDPAAPGTPFHLAWQGENGWHGCVTFQTDATGRARVDGVPAGAVRLVVPPAGRWPRDAWEWTRIAETEVTTSARASIVVR